MKKIIIIFLLVFVGGLIWFTSSQVTSNNIIKNIQIDGVDEVEKGLVTIKVNGQYYDYKYEFVEGFKTYEERQANGEDLTDFKVIK